MCSFLFLKFPQTEHIKSKVALLIICELFVKFGLKQFNWPVNNDKTSIINITTLVIVCCTLEHYIKQTNKQTYKNMVTLAILQVPQMVPGPHINQCYI